ncbi:hydroxyethylthiazole kinase [Methanocella paludicola SANAE]|uniref:Hydroxyethylthiazole kinase n=1 Tax=Methanocella paludicola (strain DSM 17711 / JCM 13418 / NBRC 101707 / SANAE) TaxID=304371 RepID=D1YXN5_METPS|nr:hydroxyethylthiazole kinase [Methanocella paludicola]BAI61207.1 hydroxyethylthiazole kinase [Methanocella paludicola SANAE]
MAKTTYASLLSEVRAKRPLVHHITNYVTVNDCANATICIGASPVMAHAGDEVAEMVSMAGALVLNIGTLDDIQVGAMLRAGVKANDIGVPIILDPVGAGATRLRTYSAQRLLHDLDIAVLKGNVAEIATLAGAGGEIKGVDSQGMSGEPLAVAKKFAKDMGIIVAVSGPTDIVTDGDKALLVDNGHPLMGRVSGTGCMAASLAGAFTAVSKDYLSATAAAFASFGLAGERAAPQSRGPASFKVALLDELYRLTPEELEKGARVREA